MLSNQIVLVDQRAGEVLSTFWSKYFVKSKCFSGPKSRRSLEHILSNKPSELASKSSEPRRFFAARSTSEFASKSMKIYPFLAAKPTSIWHPNRPRSQWKLCIFRRQKQPPPKRLLNGWKFEVIFGQINVRICLQIYGNLTCLGSQIVNPGPSQKREKCSS